MVQIICALSDILLSFPGFKTLLLFSAKQCYIQDQTLKYDNHRRQIWKYDKFRIHLKYDNYRSIIF